MSSALLSKRLVAARSLLKCSRVVAPQMTRSTIGTPLLNRLYSSKSWPSHEVLQMPALSPTMTEGGIGAYNKSVGDEMKAGDILADVSTDKANIGLEIASEEGFLAKILLEEGTQNVAVGTPMAVYVEEAEDVPAFADYTMEDANSKLGLSGESSAEPAAEQPAKEEPAKKEESAPAKSESSSPSPKDSGRISASPLARMIAAEQGIPLKSIKGTGPNGRIIKRDVEGYEAPAAAAQAPAAATPAAAPAAAAYEDIPLSAMRQTIAKRLKESKQINPDFFVSSTMSVSKLQKLRAALNASGEGAYKISVNDILIKAVAAANKAVPQVNSAWMGEQGVIRQYKNVDVSVAVATPTGLITPVVKEADKKGLASISTEVKALAKKAREGKLQPEEYQGGTISLSNLAHQSAVNNFSAIINPPQSCILAVGAIQRMAVEDLESASGVAFDDFITVNATFDHKTVDGAVGAQWIAALKRNIENPLELML